MFIAFPALTGTNVIPAKIITEPTNNAVNGTFLLNSSVGLLPANSAGTSPAGLVNVVYTNLIITNITDGEVVGTGNFTINNEFIVATNAQYNSSTVNVSVGWTHTVDSDAILVANNVTGGTVDFFNSTPTLMSILGAVMIIAAITLILFAVSRLELFGGGKGI